ncbi:Caspase domain containing protein [Lactarius tabidus]
MKQYTEECEIVTHRLARIARTIVNVGTLCAKHNVSEEDRPASLQDILDSLQRELDSITGVLEECSKCQGVKRFVLRKNLLATIRQCDSELNSALQAFHVELLLDTSVAMIALRREVAPVSGSIEEIPALPEEQNGVQIVLGSEGVGQPDSFPDALPRTPELTQPLPNRTPEPTQPLPNIPESRYPPVQSHGRESFEKFLPHVFERPPPQSLNPDVGPSSTSLLHQPHGVGRYQAPQPHPSAPQHYPPLIGQKKALLVGINYSKHRDRGLRLNSSVYDAKEMARSLQELLGFHPNNIRVLTDDQRNNLPTKGNILSGMRWLVKGAQPGDSLFFYFCGHATQIMDVDVDHEPDGLNECLCAMDYDGRNPPTGLIVNDQMHDIMVGALPRGCHMTAVLDCCNSGTLLELPYIYGSDGVLRQNTSDIVRRRNARLGGAVVTSFTSSNDSRGAYEVRGGGVLREPFIMYMRRFENSGTYLEVIESLRAYMIANGIGQRPLLSLD